MARQIWILVKKELKSYFDSPTAYVLLTVWLVLVSYFFFRAAFLIGEASIRPLFELLPWLLLFFVPAVTMRALAAEKKEGTLEILLSHPVNEAAVVVAKLVASVLFILIGLALTLPIPLGLALGGRLDIGMIIGQYLGAGFLIMGLASVGLFASSLSKNQTIAFIVALILCFVLIATGLDFIIMALPFTLTSIVRQISALSHFDSMVRGVISLADVVYFLALTVIFVALSYFGLRRERESRLGGRYKNLQVGTLMLVVVAVLAGLISSALGGRVDLTDGRVYSLSGSTAKLLKELPDPVTIKLYASRQLPPEAEVALRDARDVIIDYQEAGRGRVKPVFKRLGNDPGSMQEIQEAGIQQVQFNVVRQDEYQVKQGHLGITINYRDKRETIPFVRSTDDLEYQLSSLIRKVSATKKKKFAFLTEYDTGIQSGRPEEDGADKYAVFKTGLREQHDVEDLDLKEQKKVPADVDVVVVAGPQIDASRAELKALKAFIGRGGSALALIDSLIVNDQQLQVLPNKTNWLELVSDYGLEVEPKLLYDVRSNQPIALGGGGQASNFLMPYPFWMKVGPVSRNVIGRDIGSVTLPWGSPVAVKDKSGAEPLLGTSQFAGAQKKDFDISPQPDQEIEQQFLKSYVVAAAKKIKGGGRIIVVGNSLFLTDRFSEGGENSIFGLNAADWLAQDLSLANIRSKSTQSRILVFPSPAVRDIVRYFNLIGMPLIVAVFGIIRLSRRRALTRKAYSS